MTNLEICENRAGSQFLSILGFYAIPWQSHKIAQPVDGEMGHKSKMFRRNRIESAAGLRLVT